MNSGADVTFGVSMMISHV